MTTRAIPNPGDVVSGQYTLRREIGRGSMGVVFEAHQMGLERRVAVKMLLPDALRHNNVIDRFKREARLASSINHPSLVTIHAFGVDPLPYIVMEFLEGEDLRDHLSRVGLLPLGQALAILAPTLAAVGVAHRRGIIHRDLKPENIFLSESGGAQVVKVLDFGIARAVTANWGTMAERLTGTGMACGTPHYMAPEQLRGADDLGPPADVYSLGCVLFELLTGQPPFDGKSPVDIALKHVDRPPPPLLEEYAGTHIEYVVYRALAKNANARFPDANAMLEELKRCVEYQDPEAAGSSGEAVDWARVTIRVPDWNPSPAPVGARLELPTHMGVPAPAFQTEPDTDPAASSMDSLMRLPSGSGVEEDSGPTALWDPGALNAGDHTIPVPRLAALPEGETLEEFKRRASAWAPNTRPEVALEAAPVPAAPTPAASPAVSVPPSMLRSPSRPLPRVQGSAPPPGLAAERLDSMTSEVMLARAPRPEAAAPAPAPRRSSGWVWGLLVALAVVLLLVIGSLLVLIALRVL